MRVRGILATIATVVVLGVLASGVGAAPAQAAQSTSIVCVGDNVTHKKFLVLEPGETLTVTTAGCNVGYFSATSGTIQWVDGSGNPQTTPPALGSVEYIEVGSTVTFTAPLTEGPMRFEFNIGYVGPYSFTTNYFYIAICIDGECPVVESTPIPMWIQAYARADKDAPCLDGWEPSWDQWPNGGTGGFVCGRAVRAFG